jgi:hypothetical protein
VNYFLASNLTKLIEAYVSHEEELNQYKDEFEKEELVNM